MSCQDDGLNWVVGSQGIEDTGWSTGERQVEAPHTASQLTWALEGLCQMPLDRVRSIQEEVGTDGEGSLGPAGLCPHFQGPLILVT